MNLRTLRLAGATVLLLAICQAAVAQYESTDKSRIGLGLSFVRPSGSQLSNINGTWLGPVLDVHLAYDELDRPKFIATIGWFGEQNNTSKANFVPLKVTYIKRFGKSERGGWYVGGGLDTYFAIYKSVEYDPFIRNYRSLDEHGTPMGIGLLCGLDFGGAWYGEMRYDAVKSLSLSNGGSVNFGGLSITFGSRLAF